MTGIGTSENKNQDDSTSESDKYEVNSTLDEEEPASPITINSSSTIDHFEGILERNNLEQIFACSHIKLEQKSTNFGFIGYHI